MLNLTDVAVARIIAECPRRYALRRILSAAVLVLQREIIASPESIAEQFGTELEDSIAFYNTYDE